MRLFPLTKGGWKCLKERTETRRSVSRKKIEEYAAKNGKSIVEGVGIIISEHREAGDTCKFLSEECEKEKTDLEKRIESETEENISLKNGLNDLQKENDGFKSQLGAERRENASLGEDLEAKIHDANEKNSKIASLESDLTITKGELSSMNESVLASSKIADDLLEEKNSLELKILERDAIILERDETIDEAAVRLAETSTTATAAVVEFMEFEDALRKARRRTRWLWFAYIATTSAILASVYYMDKIGLL